MRIMMIETTEALMWSPRTTCSEPVLSPGSHGEGGAL